MSDPTSIKTPSKVDAVLARGFFYRFFSVAFRHPRSPDLRKFLNESSSILKEVVGVLDFKNSASVERAMNRFLEEWEAMTAEQWSDLYEYFFGHTANARVPAYELEYGEEHSHRQPQELADISAFYQAFGLRLSTQTHERADHVWVECEFMYYLLYKETNALAQGDSEHASMTRDASKRFLEDHLAKWLPAFTFRLARSVKEGPMKALADFAHTFILAECDARSIDIGGADLPIRPIDSNEETGCTSCQYGPSTESKADDVGTFGRV